MKRIIILLVMAICLTVIDSNAQVAKIMLKNGSKATFYNNDQLENAIKDAIDGDSIVFTEGNFKGGVIVDKKITLIGAGQNTIIQGDITVQMLGNQILNSRLLDGLKLEGIFKLASNLENVKIRKSNLKKFILTSNVTNCLIDRCYITDSFDGNGNYLKSCNIMNSYINQTSNSCQEVYFINSYLNISSMFMGHADNSIIDSKYYYIKLDNELLLKNCIVSNQITIFDNCMEECYRLNESEINNLDLTDTETLISNGYIGFDGTAVGPYGGQMPFTLELKGPKITSMELKVDAENNQLKVTATGTAK